MKKKQRRNITAALMASLIAGTIGVRSIAVYAEDDPPEPPSGDDEKGGTPPDMPSGQAPGQGGPGGGADTQTYDYEGTLNGAVTADGKDVSSSDETVTASESDQNTALAQNGGTLTIRNDRLEKSGGDSDGDNRNFYGINSIALTVGEGSKTVLSDSTLQADSEGSNGIFATDNGTVYANNDTITTSADNARGLDATYGGTIIANQMSISTQGDHCAAIATDRGGGNISVTNSSLSTAGSGSPLLYSTGDIEIDGVTGTASGSQIAGMEGLNTILIWNSDLTSSQTGRTASDPVADGIIIYQSTSGDAETTTGEKASFQAVDSTLKSAITSGSMFYLTNTSANIVLQGTTLDFDSENAKLLYAAGNDSNNWGAAGNNGADVTFTGYGETLKGDISADTISTIDAYFLDGTTYTGAVTIEENADASEKSEAPVTVNLSSDSTWVVTGDSTVTNLNVEDGAEIVDEDGKTVTIVNDGTTLVKGDSAYTITVTGSYGTSVTTDSDNALTTDYIDRTEFDSTFGTDTAFGSGSISAAAASNTVSAGSSSDTEEADENHPVLVAGLSTAAIAITALIVIGIIRKKKNIIS